LKGYSQRFRKLVTTVPYFVVALAIISFVFVQDLRAVENTGTKAGGDPTVLSNEKMEGKAKLGYAAAKEVPEICAKLFCYCGCDKADEHASLLDCFTCDHGVDCSICQEEAIIAAHLKKNGKSLAEIQTAVDTAYSDQYPWKDDPSPMFQKYVTAIKGAPEKSAADPKSILNLIPSDQSQPVPSSQKRPHAGNCCGHNGG
jgi:hypothetical protein